MAKKLISQIKSVWAASGILTVGASRFHQKQDARARLVRLGQGATSSQLSELTSVTSYRTYDSYRGVSVEFARFTEHAFGVRRVADLRPDHAEAFIRAKLVAGASCNTLRTAAAALSKFDSALARCPRKMHIPLEARLRPGLDAVRAEYNATAPRLDIERRAFFEPKAVVAAVGGGVHQLVARLQLEGGFRISEIQGLRPSDLRGLVWDPVSGTLAGSVHVECSQDVIVGDISFIASNVQQLFLTGQFFYRDFFYCRCCLFGILRRFYNFFLDGHLYPCVHAKAKSTIKQKTKVMSLIAFMRDLHNDVPVALDRIIRFMNSKEPRVPCQALCEVSFRKTAK